MLTLRQAQMDALDADRARDFEARLVQHLRTVFPSRCEPLGDQGLLDVARDGIERAESHGLSSEREICKYVDLMFVLGPGFDRDPRLPWAAEILGDPGTRDGLSRIERLSRAALDYLRGDGGDHA